jgi:phospholipid/cholesterol/gamma-HCH transport system permease protein
MLGDILAKVAHTFRSVTVMSLELIGLCYLGFRRNKQLLSKQKRKVFWLLFKRQIFNIGLKSLYINAILAILLSWLVLSKAYSLVPEGVQLSEYYAQFFVILVIRELGPLISGLVLISRSANAITFEIGHLKLHNQFEMLKAQGMDPTVVFLLPVLYAFPLSLLGMIAAFTIVCTFSSYIFIVTLYQPNLEFNQFVNMLIVHISILEVAISFFKILIGGVLIGLLCVYYGAQVGNKFTDISRAISSATSMQLMAYVTLNVGLSIVGYL